MLALFRAGDTVGIAVEDGGLLALVEKSGEEMY